MADAQLGLAPAVETLDISYTNVKQLDFIPLALGSFFRLHKIIVSGLKLRRGSLERFITHIASLPPKQRDLLHTLKIGSMGLGREAALLVTGGMGQIADLDSVALAGLLPSLIQLKGLKSLSLHSNVALDRRSQPIHDLLVDVGRRLTKLDLTGVRLTASVLMGLYAVADEETDEAQQEVMLETLLLDNTHIDDDGLVALECCKRLRALHISGSRVTGACTSLHLGSCPGELQ